MRRTVTLTFVAFALTFVVFFLLNRQMIARAAPKIVEDSSNAPSRFTAIVLGAFAGKGGPSDVLEDRLETALSLFRSGKIQRILVSGDHGTQDYDEVNAMRSWLVGRGVPSHAVFMDHAGFRTLDTMTRAAEVFEVKEALVVTQAFHQARALFLAEAAGIDATGVIADRRDYIYAGHYARREFLARALSWFDVKLFGRSPKFLGAKHPISGNATSTHDKTTTP